MKKTLMTAALLAATVLTLGQATSFADSIGYVDMEKVVSDYGKAQETMADIKVREAELRKMQAEFVKKIEEARKGAPKSPVGSSQLEKDLANQLNMKIDEYRDWATTKQKQIDEALQSAVDKAALTKKVDVVLAKQAVFNGGVDLTSDVLRTLNATNLAPAAPAAPTKK